MLAWPGLHGTNSPLEKVPGQHAWEIMNGPWNLANTELSALAGFIFQIRREFQSLAKTTCHQGLDSSYWKRRLDCLVMLNLEKRTSGSCAVGLSSALFQKQSSKGSTSPRLEAAKSHLDLVMLDTGAAQSGDSIACSS